MDLLLVQLFLQAHREAPQEIILDLDATDDTLHGKQGGRSVASISLAASRWYLTLEPFSLALPRGWENDYG